VEQSSNQGGFAVVNAASRREPKQFLVQFLLDEHRTVYFVLNLSFARQEH
jgi:hypothetical protein